MGHLPAISIAISPPYPFLLLDFNWMELDRICLPHFIKKTTQIKVHFDFTKVRWVGFDEEPVDCLRRQMPKLVGLGALIVTVACSDSAVLPGGFH